MLTDLASSAPGSSQRDVVPRPYLKDISWGLKLSLELPCLLNKLPGCAEVTISMAERLKGKRVAQREQEDAQEFLSFLLDSAHEEMIRLRSAYSQALNLAGSLRSRSRIPRPQNNYCLSNGIGIITGTDEVVPNVDTCRRLTAQAYMALGTWL